MDFLISFIFLCFGIMAKYSVNDGWSSLKKYWLHFIIIGTISLLFKIYKYFG